MTGARSGESVPPAALFLVYKFPDLDHLVPVVTRLAKEGKAVQVVSLNPLLNSEDWRIKHLQQLDGVAYDSVYRLGHQTQLEALIGWLLTRPLFRASFRTGGVIGSLHTWFGQRLITLLLIRLRGAVGSLGRRFIYLPVMRWVTPRVFGDSWGLRMLEFICPCALVVDHSARFSLLVFGPLMRAARSKGIRVLALPHSLSLFAGHTKAYALAYNRMKAAGFDAVVVPHDRLKDDMIAHGMDSASIKVLGSARYCHEWVQTLHKIVVREPPLVKKHGGLKVLYMDRGADRHGHFKDSVQRTLLTLAKLDFVNLVYKPHPRSNKVWLSKLSGRVTMATKTDSVNLVRWSDAVIGTVSSGLVEALVQDKTLIYPAFLNDEQMLFDELGACWRVEDLNQLTSALKALRVGGNSRPYSSEALKGFENLAIFGGMANRDVLGSYVDLILGQGEQ